MKFGTLNTIMPQPMSSSLAEDLYPSSDGQFKERLSMIVNLFMDAEIDIDTEYLCFIEDNALSSFECFANEIYRQTRNEATGLLVGYYLQGQGNLVNKKILIATDFLPATGNASSVTCEFSYEDSVQHTLYCEKNHVLPIIWIHSHPGFGVFYSSTDSTTLASFFARDHQMGVVVDNLQNKYLGFKISNGMQRNQDIYSFNLNECVSSGEFKFKRLNESLSISNEKKKAVSFKDINQKTEADKASTNHAISFQLLQKLSQQLERFEANQYTEKTQSALNDISKLVEQLRGLSKMQGSPVKAFSLEDMRNEIVVQISSLVVEVKETLTPLINEINTIKNIDSNIKDIVESISKSRENPTGNACIIDSDKHEAKRFGKLVREFAYSIFSKFNMRDFIYVILIIVGVILFLNKTLILNQNIQ